MDSGESISNSSTRSCFVTLSKNKYDFIPADKAVIALSGNLDRNDNVYTTGPKIYGNHLYYSGRNENQGNYLSIFSIAKYRNNRKMHLHDEYSSLRKYCPLT